MRNWSALGGRISPSRRRTNSSRILQAPQSCLSRLPLLGLAHTSAKPRREARINESWKVAITTLMFERGGAIRRNHAAQIARPPRRAGEAIPEPRVPYPPAIGAARDRRECIAGVPFARTHAPAVRRAPGSEGSMLKLFGSELALRIADLSSALLGPYATVEAPTEAIPDAGALAPSRAWRPTNTITGGTSEIQRHHR